MNTQIAEVIIMASSFDGKTTDGIHWNYLRDKRGNVRKDSKGREMKSYTWRYRDAHGKSKQITGRKLDEVRAKRDEIREALSKGAYVDPRRAEVTFREFAKRWLAARKRLVGHATWKNYKRYLDNAILPKLGDYRLRELDASILEEFVSGLHDKITSRGTKLTSGTIKQYWTTVSMIIQDALAKDILVRDPRKGVNTGEFSWAKKRYPFTPDELTAIQAAAAAHSGFMANLVTLAVETGLRISELLGLCADQIDLTSGKETLTVDRQLAQDEDKRWILKDPKSASGIRTIPLSRKAVTALRALLNVQEKEARYTMPRVVGDVTREVTVRLVFAKSDGAPITRNAISGRWRKIITAAKVQPRGDEATGIHRLRHCYAANLLALGADIYPVSKMLGHRSTQVTEMFYAHLRTETLDAIRALQNGGATVTPLRIAA